MAAASARIAARWWSGAAEPARRRASATDAACGAAPQRGSASPPERQQRRRTFRDRRAVEIEDQRDEAVIGGEAHELEHRGLAEAGDRSRKSLVAHVAVVQQLGAYIVDQRLVGREL